MKQITLLGLYDGVESSGLSRLNMPLPNPAPEISEFAAPAPPVASTSDQPASGTPQEDAAATAAAEAAQQQQQMLLQAHIAEMMGAEAASTDPNAPKKKKYAKEAWPGRKPQPAFL